MRLLIDTLEQVAVVPTAAVQRGPNGTFVYVVQPDNKVAIRNVTVSQQDEVQSVIDNGLQPDERVVTTGFARLTRRRRGGGDQRRVRCRPTPRRRPNAEPRPATP